MLKDSIFKIFFQKFGVKTQHRCIDPDRPRQTERHRNTPTYTHCVIAFCRIAISYWFRLHVHSREFSLTKTKQQALVRFGWYYLEHLEGRVTEDLPRAQLQSCHQYRAPGCFKIGPFCISIQNTDALVWCEAATGW